MAGQAPKSNSDSDNAKPIGGSNSKEVSNGGAPSQDFASDIGGSSSSTLTKGKSAATSLQSLGAITLGGISAVASYFLAFIAPLSFFKPSNTKNTTPFIYFIVCFMVEEEEEEED